MLVELGPRLVTEGIPSCSPLHRMIILCVDKIVNSLTDKIDNDQFRTDKSVGGRLRIKNKETGAANPADRIGGTIIKRNRLAAGDKERLCPTRS